MLFPSVFQVRRISRRRPEIIGIVRLSSILWDKTSVRVEKIEVSNEVRLGTPAILRIRKALKKNERDPQRDFLSIFGSFHMLPTVLAKGSEKERMKRERIALFSL